MKKKKTALIIGALALTAAASAVVIVPRFVNAKSNDVMVSAATVALGDLSNYISVTGTVESVGAFYVYPEISEKIKTVYVAVGDVVTEGQLLCELDTSDIEQSIAEQKASMSLSSQTSYNQIKESERAYNDALENLNNSTNSQINNAENALRNAKMDLDSKQKAYDDKQAELAELAENPSNQIIAAEKNIVSAEKELDEAIKTHVDNLELFEVHAISKSELDASEKAVQTAQDNYNDALDELENIKTEEYEALESEIETAKENLDDAVIAYEDAEASLRTTNVSVQQELTKYQENVESAKLSANNDSQVYALQRLERQLGQAKIKSPANGTVTGVYAKEGVAASGLLFLIEDTDSLKITTSIKEYDLNSVSLGLPAKIESDATGDDLYDGELTFIAPTSEKDSSGATISSTDVDFLAEVSVVSENRLRIGSNARVDLIYEQKENVIYIPVEAVATGMGGSNYVYYLVPQEPAESEGSPDSEMSREGSAGSEMSSQGLRPEMPGGDGMRPERGSDVAGTGMSGEGLRPETPMDDGAPSEMPGEGARPEEGEIPGEGAIREVRGEGRRGAATNSDTQYIVTRMEVTTGIETDLYIEVSGDGIRPGMLIVNNPEMVNDGDTVKIGLSNSGFGGSGGGMGSPGGSMMRIGGGPF